MPQLLSPREAYKSASLNTPHTEPVMVNGRKFGKYRLALYDRHGELIEASPPTTKEKARKLRDRQVMENAAALCGGPEALDCPEIYTMATRRELTALAGLVMNVRQARMKERRDRLRMERSLRTKAEKRATQSERWNATFQANLQKRIDYLRTLSDPASRQLLTEAEAQLARNVARQKPQSDFLRLGEVNRELATAKATGDATAQAVLQAERERLLKELTGDKTHAQCNMSDAAKRRWARHRGELPPIEIPPAPDNAQALAAARAAIAANHPGLPPHAVETLAMFAADVL